jgi:hypothetical protein
MQLQLTLARALEWLASTSTSPRKTNYAAATHSIQSARVVGLHQHINKTKGDRPSICALLPYAAATLSTKLAL